MNAPLIIAAGIAAVGTVAAVAIAFDRKRTSALMETASALGLQFEKNGDAQTSAVQSDFELFARGRHCRARNLIYGESDGTGVWIFDYRFTTGSGKHAHTHRQTVVCFSSAQLALPRFSLYREGLMSRIGSSVFGMQDIDFDTHPEFSKMFVLKGDPEHMVREVFTEDVLSFLEVQDNRLRVEGNGNRLLVYRASKKVKPASIQEFLKEGFGVFRMFTTT